MQDFSKRRFFLKTGFLSSAIILTSGCNIFGVTTSRETIKVVQNDLFPKAKELGINTSKYITVIYRHHKISKEDKEFLKNGVKWLNESAHEMFGKTYVKLSDNSRQEVLHKISTYKWGKNWISTMMHYIFEAMLGDPIYGSNKNEAGWKWLAFEGGKPQAKRMYL